MKLAYWLFGLLLLSSAAGATETAVMCTNCSTAGDFGTMAMSVSPNHVGNYPYIVINPNTLVGYAIVVTVESEVGYGGQHVRDIASSTTSTELNQAVAYWTPKFKTAADISLYSTDSSPDDGTSSFLGSDVVHVCPLFAATGEFQDMWHKYLQGGFWPRVWNALWHGAVILPSGTFVFANGDVATYDLLVENAASPSAACKYRPGTARNATGQFINDSGMGGNGHSDGRDYVVGGNNVITIYGGDWYQSCSTYKDRDGVVHLVGCITYGH